MGDSLEEEIELLFEDRSLRVKDHVLVKPARDNCSFHYKSTDVFLELPRVVNVPMDGDCMPHFARQICMCCLVSFVTG